MRSLKQSLGKRLEGLILAAAPAFTLAVYLLLQGIIGAHGVDSIGAGILIGIFAPAAMFGVFVLLSSLWSLGLTPPEAVREGDLWQVVRRTIPWCLLLFLLYVALIFALFVLKDHLERGPIPSGLSHHPLAGEWSTAACLAGVLFWVFLALFGMTFRVRKTWLWDANVRAAFQLDRTPYPPQILRTHGGGMQPGSPGVSPNTQETDLALSKELSWLEQTPDDTRNERT